MANARIRINWDAVHELLREPKLVDLIREKTRAIDAATASESRVDFSADGERPRGAVIAGYEPGATPESTRRALLGGLDG